MDLHFEFNKKTEKGYYSEVTNEKYEVIASKTTDKAINVDDFVLTVINNEELSLDLRDSLKDAYINREIIYDKEVINKTCTSIVLCLNDNHDELNSSRLIIKFNDGTRIRFNLDINEPYDYSNLYGLLFNKIKEIEILEDCVIFTMTIDGLNNELFYLRLYIKVISFYWMIKQCY